MHTAKTLWSAATVWFNRQFTKSRWADGKEPLSFEEFCVALDGQPLYPRQRMIFQNAGIMTASDLLDPNRRTKEIVCLHGKASGKTRLSAKFIAWTAYVMLSLRVTPAKYMGLAPNAEYSLLAICPSREQAKRVYFDGYLKKFFLSPLFSKWMSDPTTQFTDSTVYFPSKRLLVRVAASTENLEGYNAGFWTLDEFDLFPDSGRWSGPENIRRNLWSSACSRAAIIPPLGLNVTTPSGADSYAMKLYEDGKGQRLQGDFTFYCDKAATWKVRPTIPNMSQVEDDYTADPVRAKMCYECKAD